MMLKNHSGSRPSIAIQPKACALMALLAHSDGLKYAGAAFITLKGDERKEFLAEVERLTRSWGVQIFAGD